LEKTQKVPERKVSGMAASSKEGRKKKAFHCRGRGYREGLGCHLAAVAKT